jgi:hypothetical protein
MHQQRLIDPHANQEDDKVAFNLRRKPSRVNRCHTPP